MTGLVKYISSHLENTKSQIVLYPEIKLYWSTALLTCLWLTVCYVGRTEYLRDPAKPE